MDWESYARVPRVDAPRAATLAVNWGFFLLSQVFPLATLEVWLRDRGSGNVHLRARDRFGYWMLRPPMLLTAWLARTHINSLGVEESSPRSCDVEETAVSVKLLAEGRTAKK